ncbi:very short patch repair endonuclease [Mesorhizobium sp. CO1-1-11]|uniref:very short patch repair endonuclease n=1 Tax=Mesorhizobium sp. CO1-1-11 TaxID=2876636 RepID=UPI001CC913C6|nr:very short patch repair endonuclease [Mesorhizobium sp. CO1-1-11]MBZ9725554.1 very short patch repair endonuclease [Mesorhizobium sp. CO1-1-11]
MDVHSPSQRSFNMSRIRSAHTKPELMLRRGLFRRGFRYRLHVATLPGKPDLVFPQWQAVVQMHGCFWHGHENCVRFNPPTSAKKFWQDKIFRNRARDRECERLLNEKGWRVLTVWECALVGRRRLPFEQILDACADFLRGDQINNAIRSTVGLE